MHVHARFRLAYGLHDLEVRLTGETRMNPALQTHLRGAHGRRLTRAPCNLSEVQIVGGPTQIRVAAALGERTEPAMIEADVGVVNVAVDDVSHGVAHHLRSQRVGSRHHGVEIAPRSAEQSDHLRFCQYRPVARGREYPLDPRRTFWTRGTQGMHLRQRAE